MFFPNTSQNNVGMNPIPMMNPNQPMYPNPQPLLQSDQIMEQYCQREIL